MTGDGIDDSVARRLARSGILLGEDDLSYLRAARVSLDAARDAVNDAAREIRTRDERRWPLPPGRS